MPYTNNPHMPRLRMEAVRLVKYREWSTRKVALYMGFAQSAIVKWCKKDPTGGWHRISTKSPRPKRHPKQLPDAVIDEIVRARRLHNRSAEVVHCALGEAGVHISLSSVKRTLDRKGLLKKRKWKKWHAPMVRPNVQQPGDLVQLDTIHLMQNHRDRIYVFTLIDVFSRWAYAKAYARATTHAAVHFLKEAQGGAPFPFHHLQTDHGSEFSTIFTERSRIPHRHSRVRRPNDNAHVERFNRTVQEECLHGIPVTVQALNHALRSYMPYYNTERHHFGLNLKKPVQVIPSY